MARQGCSYLETRKKLTIGMVKRTQKIRIPGWKSLSVNKRTYFKDWFLTLNKAITHASIAVSIIVMFKIVDA